MEIQAINILDGQAYAYHLADGQVSPLAEVNTDIYAGPGLCDVQVNGFGGIDVNDITLTTEKMEDLVRKERAEGVTSFMPTVITNSGEAISQLMQILAQSIAGSEIVKAAVCGIHLEGPFISPEDGPRGAHAREYVTAPNWDLFMQWQEAAQGHIRLVTLSPEWEGSAAFIEKCVANNIRIAIGHTNATHQQIVEAVQAGASMSTHLGNGMHNILPRHPNYLWSQLAEDDLYCSVIADGFHVPAEVLKVFMKIKKDKLFLVSDSTAFAGMAPGNFHTHIGGDVTLTGKGRLHLTANPATLAGSAVSMLDCVAFMVKEGLMTAAEAWMAGSVMPRKYLDQGKEPLGGNIHDDLVFFSLADGDCRLIG